MTLKSLYFVRHGQCSLNLERRLVGRDDSSLTKLGRLQAECVALHFQGREVCTILSSPLVRAFETAKLIGITTNREVVVNASLVERDLNTYEGVSYDEVVQKRKSQSSKFVDVTQDWEDESNVETDASIFNRVEPTIMEYLSEISNGLVVVTHMGVIKTFFHRVFSISNFERIGVLKLGNCSVVEFSYSPKNGQFGLRSLWSCPIKKLPFEQK